MKTWLLTSFLFLLAFATNAQSLTASISNDSILLGNSFRYEISLSNIDQDIEPPDFREFQIISGPNFRSSVSIINGDMTSSKSNSWILKPLEVGRYFIAPVSVVEADEAFETAPIEIHVYPNPEGIIQEPTSGNTMDDFFQMKRPPIFDKDFSFPEEQPQKEEAPQRKLKKG